MSAKRPERRIEITEPLPGASPRQRQGAREGLLYQPTEMSFAAGRVGDWFLVLRGPMIRVDGSVGVAEHGEYWTDSGRVDSRLPMPDYAAAFLRHCTRVADEDIFMVAR